MRHTEKWKINKHANKIITLRHNYSAESDSMTIFTYFAEEKLRLLSD